MVTVSFGLGFRVNYHTRIRVRVLGVYFSSTPENTHITDDQRRNTRCLASCFLEESCNASRTDASRSWVNPCR